MPQNLEAPAMITVQSVELFDADCEVYDVQVEFDHSFVVEGVVLHNSDICRPLADTEWKAGDPRMPVPPLHPSCRSHLEPIVDVPGIARTQSQQPTYEQWLRAQPANVQDMIVGKGVGAHLREGKAKLGDLLTADRRPMTLSQLRDALFSAQPESYVAWIESLPEASQRAVLGPALARQVRSGEARVADVLRESANRGVVTVRP
jgi:hypothetical protein